MQPYSSNYDYQGAINGANNAYNQATANTQAANANLGSFQQTIQDPSKMYAQHLNEAQSMYGFNPQNLLQANKNLANTQTTIANLPQATQQQGNYYGTTAGAMANNYAAQAGNLQALLAGQGNAVNAYNNVLGATQNQANQQSTLGLQGQQLQAQVLQQILEGALGIQGQQGNAVGRAQTQQSNYGDYLNAQRQAQAAAQQAASAQITAQANAGLTQQQAAQIAYNMELQKQYQQQQQAASSPLQVVSGANMGLQGFGR